MKKGKVFLVGAGPGDPGLITVKGLKCLGEADVIVYDRLVDEEILEEAPPQAEKIYVGKEASLHTLEQGAINRLLLEKAGEGKRVVRLKGGDPFVLGRGGEEAEILALQCYTTTEELRALVLPHWSDSTLRCKIGEARTVPRSWTGFRSTFRGQEGSSWGTASEGSLQGLQQMATESIACSL